MKLEEALKQLEEEYGWESYRAQTTIGHGMAEAKRTLVRDLLRKLTDVPKFSDGETK